MTAFDRDRFPYTLEAPHRLYVEWSHDIDFDYTSGLYPTGSESEFDWESAFNPATHKVSGVDVGATVWRREKIGKSGIWTLPMYFKGQDGTDGTNGISIIEARIVSGDLLIYYSDGNITNAGTISTGCDECFTTASIVELINTAITSGDIVINECDTCWSVNDIVNLVNEYIASGGIEIPEDATPSDVTETREVFTIRESDIGVSTVVLTLLNDIAPDTHVIVDSDNLMLKDSDVVNVVDREYTYIEGSNVVTIQLDSLYFTIEAGDEITVHYSYLTNGSVPIPNPAIRNLTITNKTYSVADNGDITVNFRVVNNGTAADTAVLNINLDSWSITEELVVPDILSSGYTDITKTYISVSPGTYDFLITGDITDSIPNITVTALTASISGVLSVALNGADVFDLSVDVANSGSASDLLGITFRVYIVGSSGGTEADPNSPDYYSTSGVYTVDPNTSITISDTFTEMPVNYYKVSAYTDGGVLLDSVWVDIESAVTRHTLISGRKIRAINNTWNNETRATFTVHSAIAPSPMYAYVKFQVVNITSFTSAYLEIELTGDYTAESHAYELATTSFVSDPFSILTTADFGHSDVTTLYESGGVWYLRFELDAATEADIKADMYIAFLIRGTTIDGSPAGCNAALYFIN